LERPDRARRTAARATDDLRAVLGAAGARALSVLVGHSLGGLYVRHYAQRFPDEVAGLVLIDPAHEDMYERMPEQCARAGQTGARAHGDRRRQPSGDQMRQARAQYLGLFAEWPESVREPPIEHHLRPVCARVAFVGLTGTRSGVGFAETPPRGLSDGDVYEVEIEGIGRLRNRFMDEKQLAT
jgi:pimeloyl-ACP methyl ester carboxylesterase